MNKRARTIRAIGTLGWCVPVAELYNCVKYANSHNPYQGEVPEQFRGLVLTHDEINYLAQAFDTVKRQPLDGSVLLDEWLNLAQGKPNMLAQPGAPW